MGTTTSKLCANAQQGGAPYSDSFVESFQFITNASGHFVNSDVPATAVADGQVVRLGKLPAGLELHSALLTVGDAFTASTSCKIGFAYCDGVDVTAVPQDDDYFIKATASLASVGVIGSNNEAVSRVTLPKDAYLILTNTTLHASAGRADVTVFGKMKGVN